MSPALHPPLQQKGPLIPALDSRKTLALSSQGGLAEHPNDHQNGLGCLQEAVAPPSPLRSSRLSPPGSSLRKWRRGEPRLQPRLLRRVSSPGAFPDLIKPGAQNCILENTECPRSPGLEDQED
ncbi:uncharacterized protein LOC144297474 isoform X2 [Canis aureus]